MPDQHTVEPAPAAASGEKDRADVIAHPPLLALFFVGLGLVAEHFAPLPLPIGAIGVRKVLCLILFALAAGVILAALRVFVARRENPDPFSPTTAIFDFGIYRFTRNPIYLGLVIAAIAVSLQANSAWVVVMALALFLSLHFGVVLREETYLQRKFGEAYRAYCMRVRRWV